MNKRKSTFHSDFMTMRDFNARKADVEGIIYRKMKIYHRSII